MPKLVARNYSMSLDGFVAGPNQGLQNPLGEGGMDLHQWFFATRTFQAMVGKDGGSEGVDDGFAKKIFEGVGATIMGRNMFGPIRGEWPDNDWRGWWGPNPPYHNPVFVLTHFGREPLAMEGGTIFNFVTDGIEAALERAFIAAEGKDVIVGGGAQTMRAYMKAGLLDEIHLAVAPILLGRGERLFDASADWTHSYRVAEHVPGAAVTHYLLKKR